MGPEKQSVGQGVAWPFKPHPGVGFTPVSCQNKTTLGSALEAIRLLLL